MNDEQPKHEGEEEGETRRDILDGALAAGTVLLGASALYPIARYLNAPVVAEAQNVEVVAAKDSDVPNGGAVSFRFGSKPGILVRDPGGKLHAFLAICTHLECVVQFRGDLGAIWCACHNGQFDFTGRNVKGPPPRPLTALAVEVRGADIVVRRA